jgi:hypothetical protein
MSFGNATEEFLVHGWNSGYVYPTLKKLVFSFGIL